jgi:hypothetical protein
MHLVVNYMADPDISDYECDADDLLLMPIIIPQFDLQSEFPDLDSERQMVSTFIFGIRNVCRKTERKGLGLSCVQLMYFVY